MEIIAAEIKEKLEKQQKIKTYCRVVEQAYNINKIDLALRILEFEEIPER